MSTMRDGVFQVSSNSIPSGIYFLHENMFFPDGAAVVFTTSQFASCELIYANQKTEQTSSGRISGGILGLAIAGPLGAAAGLLTGGRKDIDIAEVFCTFNDGRSFSAKCNNTSLGIIKAIVAQNKHDSMLEEKANRITDKSIEDEVATRFIATMRTSSPNPEHIENTDTKECSQCAETVKFKAKVCRFCGYKFDLAGDENFGQAFLNFRRKFDDILDPDFITLSKSDLIRTYTAACAIDRKFSNLYPQLSLNKTADILAFKWKESIVDMYNDEGLEDDEFEYDENALICVKRDDYEVPDAFFFNSKSYKDQVGNLESIDEYLGLVGVQHRCFCGALNDGIPKDNLNEFNLEIDACVNSAFKELII